MLLYQQENKMVCYLKYLSFLFVGFFYPHLSFYSEFLSDMGTLNFFFGQWICLKFYYYNVFN